MGNRYKIPKKVISMRFGNYCPIAELGIDASLTLFIMTDSIFLLVPKYSKELFETLFRISREEK